MSEEVDAQAEPAAADDPAAAPGEAPPAEAASGAPEAGHGAEESAAEGADTAGAEQPPATDGGEEVQPAEAEPGTEGAAPGGDAAVEVAVPENLGAVPVEGAAEDSAAGDGEAGQNVVSGVSSSTGVVPTPPDVEKEDAGGGATPREDEGEKEAGAGSASSRHTEEEDGGSATERTSDPGSEEAPTVTSADSAPSEPSEDSDHSSTGEASSRGSTGSGGSSLTRLVERSSLEQQHRALLLLRRQLLSRNQRLQQRLSQHFSRKTDDAAERVEKNLGELEARYSRYLNGIREQQRFTAEERERRQQEIAAFRTQVEQQSEMVASAYSQAVDLRRQVALKSRSSRTGRLMAAAEVETLIGREQQKELEVQEARLESLRRETRLNRLEQQLRESEELAGGIHLIDFEQLKIENQTYAEKIEERNEDLTKLRRKISSTVQILTHLKERIQFEQTENTRRQEHLQTVSAEVTHGRESLAQLKQRRDQVRNRTAGQRATAGLLGHEALLRDFEARVDQEARLVRELQTLKRDYAEHQRMTQAIRHTLRMRKQQQQNDRRKSAGRH